MCLSESDVALCSRKGHNLKHELHDPGWTAELTPYVVLAVGRDACAYVAVG